MPKESLIYRRLPGRSASAFEHIKLYLAPDHLLLVSSTGYSESYRRFYFPDIQAITLCKSSHGKVWNGFWSILTWFSAAVGLSVAGLASVIWLAIAGVFLLLLGLNIVLGPTCVCRIQTAVQTRRLASLNRLRLAGQVLAQIKPLIEAAQGPLPSTELLRRLEER